MIRALFRLLHNLLIVLAALVLIWCIGLLWFLSQIPTESTAVSSQKADAIVVLTGGSKRIRHGLVLLRKGKGRQLLISGVHPNARAEEIFAAGAPGMKRTYRTLRHRITLGHSAPDTRGNAQETAVWTAHHNIRTLRLVTAGYHMPRSLLELQRTMPSVTLLPDPVFPNIFAEKNWQQSTRMLQLIVNEYHKLIGAQLEIYDAL